MPDESTPNTKRSAESQEPFRSGSAAARSATQGTNGAAQRSAEAAEQGTRAAGEALHRGGEAGAEVTRRGTEAGAETLRRGGEAVGETMRRGTQAAAEGQREIVADAAEQFEEIGRRMAQAVQETTEDMRRLMVLPRAAGGGWQDMQQGVAQLVEGVIRTNLHVTQEIFRLSNPGVIVDLQRRFMREYLDALIQGTTTLVRAARRTADETLRPLEQQMEQRQQARREQRGQGQQAGRSARQEQEPHGRVADVMSRQVRVANPDDTVQQATRLMRDEDTGVLPVGEGDRLVGMVTDRDVALRLVAEGKDPARTKVREVMTPEVRYVFEDEDLGHVADTMAEQQVRRLPVVNHDKRLVGVVSLGDIARQGRTQPLAGRAMAGVAREGGRHSQTAAAE
jgi:CBS domain-containing protein